jgi:hypothetical protein
VSGPIVAYEPVALAQSVRRYASAAERNLGVLDDLGDQLKPLLEKMKNVLEKQPAALAIDDFDRVTIIYDRLVKAGLNLVKATDELSRLQSFLSGGPDSRPDLSSLGEIELRAIVLTAVKSLGITDLKQLEA